MNKQFNVYDIANACQNNMHACKTATDIKLSNIILFAIKIIRYETIPSAFSEWAFNWIHTLCINWQYNLWPEPGHVSLREYENGHQRKPLHQRWMAFCHWYANCKCGECPNVHNLSTAKGVCCSKLLSWNFINWLTCLDIAVS